MKISRIKNRISEVATEACGYSPLTKVVSEEEINRILEQESGWIPVDETRKRVVWHENGWCTNEPGCDDYEELDDFDSENFEVIGNMIDNPELLEV